jgi:hypothetical protein
MEIHCTMGAGGESGRVVRNIGWLSAYDPSQPESNVEPWWLDRQAISRHLTYPPRNPSCELCFLDLGLRTWQTAGCYYVMRSFVIHLCCYYYYSYYYYY